MYTQLYMNIHMHRAPQKRKGTERDREEKTTEGINKTQVSHQHSLRTEYKSFNSLQNMGEEMSTKICIKYILKSHTIIIGTVRYSIYAIIIHVCTEHAYYYSQFSLQQVSLLRVYPSRRVRSIARALSF